MRLLVTLTILAAAVLPTPAFAAQGLPPLPETVWTLWNWGPVAGLGLAGWLYAQGLLTIWKRVGAGRGIRYWQAAAFYGGLLALVVAFITPLDALSQALFSAHMIQHLLLILIAAPLLILSKPIIPFLWALPRPARRKIGAWWREAGSIRKLWHGATQPLLVWALYALTIWVWHLPSFYQAALERAFIHELEHISFLGAALLFWWVLLQPTGHRRLNYGLGILFVFTTALHKGALGALLTFAQTPLYPVYQASVAPWNLTLLEDQQLAGLIMWIPASIIYVTTALTLFTVWINTIEEQVRRSESNRATQPALKSN